MALVLVLVACATGPAPAAPARRCDGGAISDPEKLARRAGCAEISGDLALSGAALTDLEPLASVRRIRGDLIIGPTSRLVDARGLAALESIAGDLIVARNFELGGLYLGSLTEVGGPLTVERNLVLLAVSLHRVTAIGGAVEVRGNRSLERLDLSALRRVAGDLAIETQTDLVISLPDDVEVSGERHIGPAN